MKGISQRTWPAGGEREGDWDPQEVGWFSAACSVLLGMDVFFGNPG